MTSIVWFRRDFRLADNPALSAALAHDGPVVALYIHAPQEEAPWSPGAASRWWRHHSLKQLAAALAERGSRLEIRSGPSGAALADAAAAHGASRVYWNRLYEPTLTARDTGIKQALRTAGLEAESFKAALLFEPWELQTGSGTPYRVFTPFWRAASARLALTAPLPAPRIIPAAPDRSTATIDALELAPRIRWDSGLADTWTTGEHAAHETLETFIDAALAAYSDDRDRPDRAGTSRLSPHLHFGEISPRQIVHRLVRAGLFERAGKFVSELGWREFSHHLLFHFPASSTAPLNPRFAGFPWIEPPDAVLRAWRQGRTGLPIVDAGMRELWHTGWMHNRVRMLVASLLTKNLRTHWLEGARWFWDTLVDADLANNTQGWQWSAGCGADAAPYFRIFNPVTQGERFDPEGKYVRRWVPELARVPLAALHAPWTLPTREIAACGIAGTPYARPIVDLATSRAAALEAYRSYGAGA